MSKTYCCGCGSSFEGEECVSCLVEETKRRGVEEGKASARDEIVARLREKAESDSRMAEDYRHENPGMMHVLFERVSGFEEAADFIEKMVRT